MKSVYQREGQSITLEGNVEKPTEADRKKIGSIVDELKSRHEDGIICYRSSKRSNYKNLRIEWRSKPKLVEDP